MSIDTDGIAARLITAQDHNRRIDPITSQIDDFDLFHGYAVAHRIHEQRLADGASAVGRKIGFTNSSLWPKFGVQAPIWGYIYDHTVTHVRGGHASCGLGAFSEPKIEPEVVVHFADTPPTDGDLPALLACVDWVAHAFEIVQCHYPGWVFRAPDTVADSALHGALLVGERVPIAELGADPIGTLESFELTLARNGEPVETGKGANVLGGPLAAVAHLIAAIDEPPGYAALAASEMVTTGTLTGAYSLQAGDVWSTELDGIVLPGLSVTIEN